VKTPPEAFSKASQSSHRHIRPPPVSTEFYSTVAFKLFDGFLEQRQSAEINTGTRASLTKPTRTSILHSPPGASQFPRLYFL
jgi:hypothetical protein